MAYFDAYNVQFLDLSGVDEEEKKWILTSLQIRDSSVRGPWNKNEFKQQNIQEEPIHNNNVLQQRTFDPYQTPSTIVIPNHVSTIHQNVYPRPYQQPLSVYPPAFVTSPVPYQTPIVVNAPVVPVNAVVSPIVPVNASIVPVNAPIVPVNAPILPVNPALTPIVSRFPQAITYPNITIPSQNPPINISNSYPRTLPIEAHNVHTPDYNITENNTDVVINLSDEDINNVDNDNNENVDDVNNISNGSGPSSNLNEVLKSNENERKSWASLFNKQCSVNECSNGNEDASKPLAKVSPFVQNLGKNVSNEFSSTKKSILAEYDDPNYYRMGEILVNYSLDHRITSLQPRGLINHSNYCYINSILQAMMACPPVYNLLNSIGENTTLKDNRKHTQIIDNMIKFVNEFHPLPPGQRVRRSDSKTQKKEPQIYVNCDRPFEPFWIYKMLNGIRSDSFVVEGRQEDAEEFLGCLLNGLNDEMLELMKLIDDDEKTNEVEENDNVAESDTGDKEWQVIGPKNKGCVTRRTEIIHTPISNIFGGHIRSRLHRAGDQITDNIQPFFTLQLNIEKVTTVREALEALFCKNQLEGVTSSKTNEVVEAWQQVTIEELPVVLILHLKCFDFKLDGCTKIIKALEFPVDLKIDSKLLSSKTTYQAKEKQYKLFAVVYHDGKEATKGHYVTDAYHIGYASWIRYDDTSVRAVQEEQVLKPHGTRVPYLLFYRRSDTVRK